MTSTPCLPDPSKILLSNVKSKRDLAVELATAGFNVLPLPPNQKAPPTVEKWQERRNPDPTKIHAEWTAPDGTPRDYNPGVITGDSFLVLDFDRKKGGCESYARLTVLDDRLPATFTVRTQGGGYHVYLAHDGRIPSGVNVLDHVDLPGVDLRGSPGYVAAPGATVNGNGYESVNALPIARAPAWLIEALGSRRRITKASQQPLTDLDTAEAIALAAQWLENEAEEAVEGAGGDSATYRVAARLRDFAISESLALELLLEHWNERQSPPWAPDELERKVAHAYTYGTATPGVALATLAHHEFDPLPDDLLAQVLAKPRPVLPAAGESAQTPPAERPKLLIKPWANVSAPRVPWLVHKLVPQAGFGTIFGQPGSYKSFVALHLAACIGAGVPFLGRKANQGDVVYLAAEGGSGLRQRLDAIESIHGISPARVGFIDHALDLRSSVKDCDALLDAIRAGHWRPSLIVIDTLARSFGGGNENASEDMGAFVNIVDFIRKQTGAAVLAVHHSGKDTAKGMRGHSSLFGAIDTELEVEKIRPAPVDGRGTGGGRLRVSKQKDAPDGFTLEYAVEKVIFGGVATGESGEDGWADEAEERSSLAVREYRDGESRAAKLSEIRLSEAAHRALDVFRAKMDGGVWNLKLWRQAMIRNGMGVDEWAGVRKELRSVGAYETIDSDRKTVRLGSLFARSAGESEEEEGDA